MASLVEAFDSTMKEALAGFKVFLWAVPITLILTSEGVAQIFIGAIVGFFILGFIVTLANNVIAKAQMILPGINIFVIIKNAILGLVAMLPHAIIAGLIIWAYFSYVTIPSEVWDVTFKILVCLFALSLPLTSICILIRRLNPFEAYNIKKYFSGVCEVFLSYSTFSLRALLGISVLFGFLWYLFVLFIGFENYFWKYVVAINLTIFLFLFSNAVAQISDDIYTFPEKEAAKKKDQAAVEKLIAEENTLQDANKGNEGK